MEDIRAQESYFLRNNNRGQTQAIVKGISLNSLHRIRNLYGFQTSTAVKQTHVNCLEAFGNIGMESLWLSSSRTNQTLGLQWPQAPH